MENFKSEIEDFRGRMKSLERTVMRTPHLDKYTKTVFQDIFYALDELAEKLLRGISQNIKEWMEGR